MSGIKKVAIYSRIWIWLEAVSVWTRTEECLKINKWKWWCYALERDGLSGCFNIYRLSRCCDVYRIGWTFVCLFRVFTINIMVVLKKHIRKFQFHILTFLNKKCMTTLYSSQDMIILLIASFNLFLYTKFQLNNTFRSFYSCSVFIFLKSYFWGFFV